MYTPSARNSAGTAEDCVLCIDVSSSMHSDDYKPSRLEAAQIASKRFIEVKRRKHPKDRVALVGFSSRAKLEHPLQEIEGRTIDRAIDKLSTRGSTNISAGLSLSIKVLSASKRGRAWPRVPGELRGFTGLLEKLFLEPEPSPAVPEEVSSHLSGETRRIIVLSDGDSNSGPDPVSTAQGIKAQGVLIDVIGIGQRDSTDFDEKTAKAIASPDRYWWIGDTEALVEKFEQLGMHIRKLGS